MSYGAHLPNSLVPFDGALPFFRLRSEGGKEWRGNVGSSTRLALAVFDCCSPTHVQFTETRCSLAELCCCAPLVVEWSDSWRPTVPFFLLSFLLLFAAFRLHAHQLALAAPLHESKGSAQPEQEGQGEGTMGTTASCVSSPLRSSSPPFPPCSLSSPSLASFL